MNSKTLHEVLVLYTGFSENAVLIIPSDEFLCHFFCLFKFNPLCSVNINRFLSIWRHLSPYLQLTACMCNGKECYRLELETTSLGSSRQSLMLLRRIVSTTIHPWLLLTIAVLPQNLVRSHQVIAHTARWSCKSLNIILSNQSCSKTAKIHTQSQSLKAGSLMIQKLEMKRAPNIISSIPTCLRCHRLADLGMLDLGWLHYSKLLKL